VAAGGSRMERHLHGLHLPRAMLRREQCLDPHPGQRELRRFRLVSDGAAVQAKAPTLYVPDSYEGSGFPKPLPAMPSPSSRASSALAAPELAALWGRADANSEGEAWAARRSSTTNAYVHYAASFGPRWHGDIAKRNGVHKFHNRRKPW
jgi:hypothetical protein